MTADLAVIEDPRAPLIRAQVAPSVPNLTNDELALGLAWCGRYQLDPLAGHVYALRSGPRVTWNATIQGLRALAERTQLYEGQGGPWWSGPDLEWREAWIPGERGTPPWAAKVEVYRAGFRAPVVGVAKWATWAKRDREGQPRDTWKALPDHMLAVRAEALALKRAFPAVCDVPMGDESDAFDARRRAVFRVLNTHGVRDTDERHALVLEATAGATSSTKALTAEQAANIISHVEERE